MKLNEQEKMPLCVLYSMDFWLFMMSPEEKLAGILEGEGVSKGVKGRRREGEGEGSHINLNWEKLAYSTTVIVKVCTRVILKA